MPDVDLSMERFRELIGRLRDLDLNLRSGVFPADGYAKRLFKHVLGGRTRLSYYACALNPRLRTLIWKDPMAAFMAKAATIEQQVSVVLCVRDPWAVAASFKRMNWGQDFASLARRLPALGLDLPPFDVSKLGPAEKAAVLWNAIYRFALADRSASKALLPFHIEQAIQDPVTAYRSLYQRLDLPFTLSVRRRIEHAYRARRASGVPPHGRAHTRKRDLTGINRYWRELLTDGETHFVEQLNGELWRNIRTPHMTD